MKANLRLPVFPHHVFLVGVGRQVTGKTVLAKQNVFFEEKPIPLAQLLHIAPSRVLSFLKKNVGEEVLIGDTIAEKRGFLHTLTVKSPITGILKEVDLTRGTLTVSKKQEKEEELISPVAGKILHVTNAYIEIETEGQLYKLQKGGGEAVSGELFYFAHEEIDMFDVDENVSGKIVVCSTFGDDILTKLDVLETKGIIFQKPPKGDIDIAFSWGQVEKDVFLELGENKGKTVWLQPEAKQVLVLE